MILYCDSSPGSNQLYLDLITAGYEVEVREHGWRQPIAIYNGTVYQDFFDIRRNLLPKTIKVPAYPAKT